MSADWPADTLLMFLPAENALIPINPIAFTVAQSSRRELRAYQGAIVVARDGRAAEIESIELGGLWGQSVLRRLRSMLTGVRAINTRFQPVTMEIDAFRSMISECLSHDLKRGDPYLPQEHGLETTLARVEAASSFQEIFQVISVPRLEDSLDVF